MLSVGLPYYSELIKATFDAGAETQGKIMGLGLFATTECNGAALLVQG